jgi:ketosteroid isomerase-like protein
MKYLLILVGLLVAGSATADGQGPTRRVPTMTRNVLIFSQLENDWIDAVQKHDTKALDKLVAPDYELRSGATPGVPTPRDDSLKQSFALPAFQSSISQMAVHEYPDLMVVSFLWTITPPQGTGIAQKVFVVDTWKRVGDSWQVLVRYASPSSGAATAIPGAVAPSAESLNKKI